VLVDELIIDPLVARGVRARV